MELRYLRSIARRFRKNGTTSSESSPMATSSTKRSSPIRDRSMMCAAACSMRADDFACSPTTTHRDSTPMRGYEPTREAAMAAFAKSWRREKSPKVR